MLRATGQSGIFVSEERLITLLGRTAQFHEAVHAHIGNLVPAEGTRYLTAFQAALLSLEHASGAYVLIGQGLFPSAYVLLRPQYECLVRGIWLLYAASDAWVEKLSEPLTLENAKRANEGPMLAEMLKQLESNPSSPAPIVEQLKQYRDVTWRALSSYSHGRTSPSIQDAHRIPRATYLRCGSELECRPGADNTTCIYSVRRSYKYGARPPIPHRVCRLSAESKLWVAQEVYGSLIDVHEYGAVRESIDLTFFEALHRQQLLFSRQRVA